MITFKQINISRVLLYASVKVLYGIFNFKKKILKKKIIFKVLFSGGPRWQWHWRMLNSPTPMSKLKYTCIWKATTPARQMKTEGTASEQETGKIASTEKAGKPRELSRSCRN